uniref:Uncharacterized protein n=1 Tax=Spongospora subterranea TaxID=70186 RepID=A0A0H5QYW3_9EUKA|eukprot:CRZ07130.1 hypothetical protein [Spongospora subterranea]
MAKWRIVDPSMYRWLTLTFCIIEMKTSSALSSREGIFENFVIFIRYGGIDTILQQNLSNTSTVSKKKAERADESYTRNLTNLRAAAIQKAVRPWWARRLIIPSHDRLSTSITTSLFLPRSINL